MRILALAVLLLSSTRLFAADDLAALLDKWRRDAQANVPSDSKKEYGEKIEVLARLLKGMSFVQVLQLLREAKDKKIKELDAIGQASIISAVKAKKLSLLRDTLMVYCTDVLYTSTPTEMYLASAGLEYFEQLFLVYSISKDEQNRKVITEMIIRSLPKMDSIEKSHAWFSENKKRLKINSSYTHKIISDFYENELLFLPIK